MDYRVHYDSLDGLCKNIEKQVSDWSSALDNLSIASQTLIQSPNMSGVGANAIRDYMTNIHKLLQGLIGEVIYLHMSNCLLYFDDYQYSVDSALHTVINAGELARLKEDLEKTESKAIELDQELATQLGRIRDIFSVSYRDASDVIAEHRSVINRITRLDESVLELESRHVAADFTSTGDMIAAITAFIKEFLGKPRGSQASFDMESLATSQTFAGLYAAHLLVSGEIEKKESMIQSAIQRQDEREEQLYIERQEETKAARWLLVGACVLLSVGVIALSGGTATPLVVGLASGVAGFVGAAGNNILDQYVETGSFENLNWGQIGKEAVIGGVVGFATGYISAGISGAVTDSVSKTVVGKALLGSSNSAVRIGTAAAIGSVSEVAGGMASRGAETMLRTGDLGEAWESATDAKSIVTDAVIGGVSGGYGEHKKDRSNYTDWNNTSNTNEEMDIMREMEANGDFDVDGEYYGTAEIDPDVKAPKDLSMRKPTGEHGTIIGDRDSGTFEYIPDDDAARQTMAKYGQDTIHVNNSSPELSPYTKHNTQWGEVDCEVEVGYMTTNRPQNYDAANEALAEKITKQTGVPVTKDDVKSFVETKVDGKRAYTWHEVDGNGTMQLVPAEIHENVRHTGAVGQRKYEMAWGDVAMDDGISTTAPRADAPWDMGDALIGGTGDLFRAGSNMSMPKFKSRSNLDQIFENLRTLTAN